METDASDYALAEILSIVNEDNEVYYGIVELQHI